MNVFRIRNKKDGRFWACGKGNISYSTRTRVMQALKTGYKPYLPDDWEIVEYELVVKNVEDLSLSKKVWGPPV